MKLLITILLCIFCTNSFSDSGYSFSNGNEFYNHCKNINATFKPTVPEEVVMHGVNLGGCYASAKTAFEDVINVSYLWLTSPKAVYCYYDYYDIDHVTSQQILDMTLKYIKDNPEHRTAKIGMIVAAMLKEKFPFPDSCSKLR